MFGERIKEETKAAHQSLEKLVISRIHDIHKPADYDHLLVDFFHYFHPLEKMIDAYINNLIIPRYSDRRKSSRLQDDAKHIILNKFGDCDSLPVVNDIAAALGVMYVLEGSTLGGTHISRMLKTQAGIADDHLRFFNGYGLENGEMWGAFSGALVRFAESNRMERQIIDTANQTFRLFERFLLLSDTRRSNKN